jgi:hypothetical protein
MMREIIGVHFPHLERDLTQACIDTFYHLREIPGVEKKPATRELINWIRALRSDPGFQPKKLGKEEVPYLGVLFKKSADYLLAAQQVARWVR